MKLPEDKNERIKVLIMILLGSLLALYGLVIGIIKPLISNKQIRTAKIIELETKLKEARRDIDDMMIAKDANDKNLREILKITRESNYLIKPNLGNYLLGASEIIKSYAEKAGIEIDVREIGRAEIPQSRNRKSKNFFMTYSLRVTLESGIHNFIHFIRNIEENNPYLCISALDISENISDPAKHKIAFDVQWPTWMDNEVGEKICDKAEARFSKVNSKAMETQK